MESVEEMRRRCRSAGTAREFQFPGDLWLPRRENRCRQPPNNHTSYDYHTPGVYTRAPYPRLSFALSSSLSLSRSHACTFSCAPSSLPPSHHLSFSLSLPTFFISTCLITNNQAYLPVSLEKNCPGFELLRITPLSFAHDSCSYSLLLLRPRFKLSYEVRIIIYWSFVSDIQVAVSLAMLNVRLTKCATHCFSSSFFSFFFFSF